MITQAFHIIFHFLGYTIQIMLVSRKHSTGKHHVLPNKNTVFVAHFIKYIHLINTSAPNTQHIHIHISRGFDDIFIPAIRHPVRKIIQRNIISSFHKDIFSIQSHKHRLSLFIFFTNNFQCPDTRPHTVRHLAPFFIQYDIEIIQPGFTQSVSPPQFRILHFKVHPDRVHPFG